MHPAVDPCPHIHILETIIIKSPAKNLYTMRAKIHFAETDLTTTQMWKLLFFTRRESRR